MPRGDMSSKANPKRPARASEKGSAAQGPARPEPQARAWAAITKLPGEGKKSASRRNLPSGPLGGSGRKSNVPRSS